MCVCVCNSCCYHSHKQSSSSASTLTNRQFSAAACTVFAVHVLELDVFSNDQQAAQKRLVSRLLGNPRMWWDENNSQHSLLLYLQKKCALKIQDMKRQQVLAVREQEQRNSSSNSNSGTGSSVGDATTKRLLPTVDEDERINDEDDDDDAIQRESKQPDKVNFDVVRLDEDEEEEQVMQSPLGNRVLSVISPSTPDKQKVPCHMDMPLFAKCWYVSCRVVFVLVSFLIVILSTFVSLVI